MKEEPKQETLEEAAQKATNIRELTWENEYAFIKFIEGAKWQQERSYSEEDMIKFAYNYIDEKRDQGARALTPELLIKQFKKK